MVLFFQVGLACSALPGPQRLRPAARAAGGGDDLRDWWTDMNTFDEPINVRPPPKRTPTDISIAEARMLDGGAAADGDVFYAPRIAQWSPGGFDEVQSSPPPAQSSDDDGDDDDSRETRRDSQPFSYQFQGDAGARESAPLPSNAPPRVPTLYDVLGVDASAAAPAIRAAFASLAKQHHPDAPSANAAEYDAVARAYEVLSSPSKRALYDNVFLDRG
ncbi:hypothetical protein M885DRAFT_556512 [Pelagophyceae sp. CCMP2097]|nr:hypothetical protein M885DRAFT_556512 [Pelagophyceae sp. CCMP2097]